MHRLDKKGPWNPVSREQAAMGVLLVLDSLYTECYNNWCNSTLHRLDIKSPERAMGVPLVL